MTEQYQRFAGVTRQQMVMNALRIVHEQMPAFALAEVTERAGMFAMAPVIVHAHDEASFDCRSGESPVATGVLTQTVQNLDNAAYFGRWFINVGMNRMTRLTIKLNLFGHRVSHRYSMSYYCGVWHYSTL